MTFYYVKFFTHKTYLFYGLLFTHTIVKAPVITTFYTYIDEIVRYKKTCLPYGKARLYRIHM